MIVNKIKCIDVSGATNMIHKTIIFYCFTDCMKSSFYNPVFSHFSVKKVKMPVLFTSRSNKKLLLSTDRLQQQQKSWLPAQGTRTIIDAKLCFINCNIFPAVSYVLIQLGSKISKKYESNQRQNRTRTKASDPFYRKHNTAG